MNKVGKLLTPKVRRGLGVVGITAIVVAIVFWPIWPLPQLSGNGPFWQTPTNVAALGGFPWLYVTAVDGHSVKVSPSKLSRTAEYFETGKVAFISFADKDRPGGVARRLTAKDAGDGSLLLSVVAWGREEAEDGADHVVGLILADVGPPTTVLFVNGKTMTVGERCQRLVYELLEKEKKEKKSAEESAE